MIQAGYLGLVPRPANASGATAHPETIIVGTILRPVLIVIAVIRTVLLRGAWGNEAGRANLSWFTFAIFTFVSWGALEHAWLAAFFTGLYGSISTFSTARGAASTIGRIGAVDEGIAVIVTTIGTLRFRKTARRRTGPVGADTLTGRYPEFTHFPSLIAGRGKISVALFPTLEDSISTSGAGCNALAIYTSSRGRRAGRKSRLSALLSFVRRPVTTSRIASFILTILRARDADRAPIRAPKLLTGGA